MYLPCHLPSLVQMLSHVVSAMCLLRIIGHSSLISTFLTLQQALVTMWGMGWGVGGGGGGSALGLCLGLARVQGPGLIAQGL